jgi:putative tryptophan/tyrosine transport system substrate-binding protein
MKRRDFITLAGAAVTWPLAVWAQQPLRIAKVGHLESGLPSSSPNLLAAFRQGLRALGYVEGQNLFIESRYAEGKIVFVGGGDPVQMGLIKSFAHPGGNVTGLTFVTVDLASKRIQLLKEAVPTAARMAILWNPDNAINKLELKEAMTTGEALGLTPLPIEIRVIDDIDSAFSGTATAGVTASATTPASVQSKTPLSN